MNKILKYLLTLSLITNSILYGLENFCNSCSTCSDCNNCCLGKCDGYPYLQIRSQGTDAARNLVQLQQFVNKYDMDTTYGALSITSEYSQSFRPERLTNFLFGSDINGCQELYIQGSQVTDRNPKAWLADYFGLPTDFQSKLSFSPKVQNAIFDFNFYLGLDELAEGLFFKINFPLVWTKWQLCPHEYVIEKGVNGFAAGYMATTTISRSNLADNFLYTMNGDYIFGDMQTPIKAGKFINNCDTIKTKLAQIDLELGWNFILQENYNFGISIYTSCPTGNSPTSTYLFEPIAGNGKHWELGAGLNGSWTFYRSQENPDRNIGLWVDATISHLFKSCQCRSFDFCNKPNSRYMLLEEMGTNNDDINADVNGNTTTASEQYKRNLIPAINWSTFAIDVRIDVQVDAVAKLGFMLDNWNFDLGYNFWARSGEKFCNDKCGCDSTKLYSIKGDTWIYGAQDNGIGNIYPLSASQSLASIHSGKNYPSVNGDNPKTNPRIDKPYDAKKDATELFTIAAANKIKTSINPVTITRKNLNLGKSPSSISNSAFSNLGYAWKDKEGDYVPFLGIGAKIEFAKDNYDDCCCSNCNNTNNSSSCNSCNCSSCSCSSCSCNSCDNNSCDSCPDNGSPKGGVSTWGIWIKGGLAFD